jgi:hypothetical protein
MNEALLAHVEALAREIGPRGQGQKQRSTRRTTSAENRGQTFILGVLIPWIVLLQLRGQHLSLELDLFLADSLKMTKKTRARAGRGDPRVLVSPSPPL